MKPNLSRFPQNIPTCWGARPLIRAVEKRGQSYCYLYVGLDYLAIEWEDSTLTMAGVTYKIS